MNDPSTPSKDWPEVHDGGSVPDAVETGHGGFGLLRIVVAHGTVLGVPWRIQAFTTESSTAKEHLSLWLEVVLGARGDLGGGSINANPSEGTHLTLAGHFFGSYPDIVSWSGVVSAQTDDVEVRLIDGREKRIDPLPGPKGFPRFFSFFPPRDVPGEVVALDAEGNALQTQQLFWPEVSRGAHVGVAYPPFGPST